MDRIARPALGIGIGSAIAAMLSRTGFAATFGLADADLIAVEVAAVSIAVWLVCRTVQVRKD